MGRQSDSALGDLVKLIFHVGGEIVIHFHVKVFRQQITDDRPGLGGMQAAIGLRDVIARLNDTDGRGVGAGPANAVCLPTA